MESFVQELEKIAANRPSQLDKFIDEVKATLVKHALHSDRRHYSFGHIAKSWREYENEIIKRLTSPEIGIKSVKFAFYEETDDPREYGNYSYSMTLDW